MPFPNFKILANAFGIKYYLTENENNISKDLQKIHSSNMPCINEIKLDLEQVFSPKLANKTSDDGTLIPSGLENMAPFLSDEQIENIKNEAFKI